MSDYWGGRGTASMSNTTDVSDKRYHVKKGIMTSHKFDVQVITNTGAL